MTEYTEYRPREIVFDVSGELKTRLDALIPWGQKGKLLSAILEDIADMLEDTDRSVLIALILDNRIQLSYKMKDADERPIVSGKA